MKTNLQTRILKVGENYKRAPKSLRKYIGKILLGEIVIKK